MGGLCGYINYTITDYDEPKYCDYFISFGRGVTEKLDDFKTKTVTVGSPVISEAARFITEKNKIKFKKNMGIEPNKKTVIYVTSPILREDVHGDHFFYVSDHTLFNWQKKVIDILTKHDEYTYIVKLFPKYREKDPLITFINDKDKKNIIPVYETQFIKLLPLADLIIMDSPSTPLLEALATKQKIMIGSPYRNFYPDALELLKKRIYYSEDIQEYSKQLDEELSGGNFDIKEPNMEFSDQYCIYKNRESIENNLSNFILEILK